jgi:hypothetical protein
VTRQLVIPPELAPQLDELCAALAAAARSWLSKQDLADAEPDENQAA